LTGAGGDWEKHAEIRAAARNIRPDKASRRQRHGVDFDVVGASQARHKECNSGKSGKGQGYFIGVVFEKDMKTKNRASAC
jgi:hypothetical protein